MQNIALKAWNFSNLEPKEFLRTTVYSWILRVFSVLLVIENVINIQSILEVFALFKYISQDNLQRLRLLTSSDVKSKPLAYS